MEKKCRIGNAYLCIESKVYASLYGWMTLKMAGSKQNLEYVYLGCAQRECKSNENIVHEHRKKFASRISAGAIKIVAWSYEMEGHAKKCEQQ